ncbi:NAD-binding protein [Shewanella benthica]|uniref:2-hydroxy-3-oxopropionate reductase n=1 Tax=Shewanella benthica KT99 TaxID=314608 RepID=A9DMH8_9GAMM|nr:NAD-binding protein [Shewanella benthica]EDP98742.1 2-hydroxy-3-oxopropionate reductase [Shewanella benthica KT99]
MAKLAFIGLGVMGYPMAGHLVKSGHEVSVYNHTELTAQSWQMENRYQTMWHGEYNLGFAVDWMRTDLNITLNEARKNGSHLPLTALTALVDQFYAEVQAIGGNRWDTSSLLAQLERSRK